MAAGAMATFISRVSSFLLAAATLSATNQPLNNQQHLQHNHNHNQQYHSRPHHQHQQLHPSHQFKFHQQPQSTIAISSAKLDPTQQHHHMASLLASPINHRHHLPLPSSHHPHQQLTNRQATVSHLFGGAADSTSSSTSRASNTQQPAGGVTFTAGSSSSSPASSPASAPSPSPASIPLVQRQAVSQSALSSAASAAAASQSNSLSSSSSPLASTIFDVFEYVMHYKPSTALISPSSLAFNTIPLNHFNTIFSAGANTNKHQRHQQAAASSLHQSPPLAQISAAALQQQNRRHYQQQQSPISQQVLQPPPPPQQQPSPPQKAQQQHLHLQHLQQQKANNGSLASSSLPLPEIPRSSATTPTTTAAAAATTSSGAAFIGRGILSRFSLLQSASSNNQRREDVCGRTMQTAQRRIIGGEGARYGEFPYQVHIKIAKHQCGGALIDRQSIVTAAHCVYHFMTRAPVSKLQIVIGAYDIEDEQYQELPPQYFKVNKVKLHPQFRFSASHPDRYDIAILKLDKPVKYTDNVLPVCLPSRELKFESMIGTVTGFGKTDPSLSNRYGTRLLQKVDVPIIENNECERWHRTRGIDLKIFPEMMCAGYEDGLKDACVGDSGGPLVVKTSAGPNGAFRWTLAGITSAGFGCAQSRQPGIYHRVSHTVDWILENLES